MDLEKLKELRNLILEQYNILEQYSSDQEKQQMKEMQEIFINESFTVSFCGQIKAGKSTLLNALLFKKEILPSDGAHHTAKLVKISYSDKPYFEVEFYNDEEWAKLKENYNKNENTKKIFEEDVNAAVAAGVYQEEVSGQTQVVKDLSLLREYASKIGKYTSYVKMVNLYYPNNILKDITFVDTPGINDTNIIREQITKDWIRQSNAVVYVIYANQAFDKQDHEFIEKYLSGIDRDYLIYAVNKVDLITEEGELDSWLKTISNSDKFKGEGFFKDNKSIIKVSSLGSLLASFKENNEIPQKYDSYMDNIKPKWLSPDENGIKNLYKLIEERIIKNREDDKRIEAEIRKIKSEYNLRISRIEYENKRKEDSLRDINSSIKERNEIKNELHEEINKLITTINKIRNAIYKEFEAARTRFISFNSRNKENIRRTISSKLNNASSLENLKAKAYEGFIEAHSISTREFQKGLKSIKEKIEEEFGDIKNHIERDFREQKITLPTFELLNFLRETNDIPLNTENFKIPSIQQIIHDSTNWWQRLWDTKGGIESAAAKIITRGTESIYAVFEKLAINTIMSLHDALNQQLVEAAEAMVEKENEIKTQIHNIDNELEKDQNSKSALENDIQNNAEIIKKINSSLNDFEIALKGLQY
ncbi:MAG: dynamin family protein [Candidatus Micrarchaeaceae archaeon]